MACGDHGRESKKLAHAPEHAQSVATRAAFPEVNRGLQSLKTSSSGSPSAGCFSPWAGASPRASIWLGLAARAHAFLNGRGYVTPQDVKSMAPDVLRHRIILSYEAEAEEMSTDDLIKRLLERIEVP